MTGRYTEIRLIISYSCIQVIHLYTQCFSRIQMCFGVWVLTVFTVYNDFLYCVYNTRGCTFAVYWNVCTASVHSGVFCIFMTDMRLFFDVVIDCILLLPSICLLSQLCWGIMRLSLFICVSLGLVVIDVLYVSLQYFDTVGWVFWPVKTVSHITYTVLEGT